MIAPIQEVSPLPVSDRATATKSIVYWHLVGRALHCRDREVGLLDRSPRNPDGVGFWSPLPRHPFQAERASPDARGRRGVPPPVYICRLYLWSHASSSDGRWWTVRGS